MYVAIDAIFDTVPSTLLDDGIFCPGCECYTQHTRVQQTEKFGFDANYFNATSRRKKQGFEIG